MAAHRTVHRPRIALLEIGPTAAPDQQAVAGERHALVVDDIGDAPVGVARRSADLEISIAEVDAIAMRKIAIGARGAARRGGRDVTAELPLQQPPAGHMIGMNVRLERGDELEAELLDQRCVASRLLENRVDQEGLVLPPHNG